MSNGRMIEFSTSRGDATGYLSGAGKAAVLVVQEWWGLVPHIKDVSDRLAAQGYLVLAPDLYHGKSTVDAEEAHHLMTHLDWPRAVDEFAGAAAHLRAIEQATRVGVVGFCMGGAVAVLVAASGAVDAYVSYYGFPPDARAAEAINVPGRFFFGEHEDTFSLNAVRAFVDKQQKKGVDTELTIYPGARHAFFNDTRKEVYHPEASVDAWTKTLDFFRTQLVR